MRLPAVLVAALVLAGDTVAESLPAAPAPSAAAPASTGPAASRARAPAAVPPVVVAPPNIGAPPSGPMQAPVTPGTLPPPVRIDRPTLLGPCDAHGCWTTDGARLPRTGPNIGIPSAGP